MQIVIPLEGRVRTVIRSSFVAAKRLAESQYTLSGDIFQMTGVTAEQVLILPDTVGVSEGQTVTDEELLSVQPALEGRVWQTGLFVQIGDVYSYGGFLWRCIQAHTTQTGWEPDKVPALWHKVEIVHEDEVRVWQAGVNYAAGDEVAYPDANGTLYACLQGHTALAGWEPPNVPALWKAKAQNEPAPQIALN